LLSVSIRQLEYAIAVAKHGSVTLAAEQLHVSQPALSVAINKLEQQLEQAIFIRRKGSALVLTAYGRDFIAESIDLLQRFEQLVCSEGKVVNEQTVVIGFYEDLAPLISGPILACLKARFPANTVHIRSGDFESLSDDLLAGRVDFVLSYNLGLNALFETHEIAAIFPHVLLYPEHPLACKASLSLADIAVEKLVLADQRLSLQHITALFRQRQLVPADVYRAPTFEMMRSLVANGQGLGISYTQSQSALSYDGKPLLYRWIDDVQEAEPLLVVSSRDNPLSSTAKHYIDLIEGLPIWAALAKPK